MNCPRVFFATILTVSCAFSVVAQNPPVLLVSIDGLRPDYVLNADAHGLKVPNLRRMLSDGAFSSGVHGVLPTVTYPSHTTLVTGVSPARHGICANTTFDPEGRNQDGWYWYATDIRVPTLWDEAGKAGLITANVHWPVTVGAKIDFNLPQIWRANTADDRKLLRELASPGLVDFLERDLPPYADGGDEGIAADERRTEYVLRLWQLKRPGFMTFYLASLDHKEHQFGPFSPEANETLERIDGLIGKLRAAVGPTGTFAAVSDHGFLPIKQEVNLLIKFRESAFVTGEDYTHLKSWKAAGWASGASAAVLMNANEPAVTDQVGAMLRATSKDWEAGIARVLDQEEIRQRGGCPASYWVELQPGFTFGPHATGALVTPSNQRGMHGYLAERREMNAAFFIAGPGIEHGKALGEIDMRDVAPTLAGILGVKLSTAEGRDLFAATPR